MITPLHVLPSGSQGVICQLDDAHPATCKLRRLGLHEGVLVEMVSGHDPVILRCHRTRIAVKRDHLTGVRVCLASPAKNGSGLLSVLRHWLDCLQGRGRKEA